MVNEVGGYFPNFYFPKSLVTWTKNYLVVVTIQVDESNKLFKYEESNNSYIVYLDNHDWVCLDWSDLCGEGWEECVEEEEEEDGLKQSCKWFPVDWRGALCLVGQIGVLGGERMCGCVG